MAIEDEPTQPFGTTEAPGPLKPMSDALRKLLFGTFAYTPDPQPGNPEHVAIAEPWPSTMLVTVQIPQLPGRHIRIHRRIRWQFVGLWQAWQDAGLLPLVLSFDGAWASRYKRGRALPPFGRETDLSVHAWAAAFDVNAAENPLGQPPTTLHGSTVRLVPLADKWGFAWGGNFHGRCDPMHFECARVIPAPEGPRDGA